MAELIVARNLRKVYGTDVKTVALDGVSFGIQAGEFAAMVGQSGSGKSTLLNLLGMLDSPTSGTVYFKRRDVSAGGKGQRAKLRNRSIGFVFQFHYLLPEFTVLENVLMPSLVGGGFVSEEIESAAYETLRVLSLEGTEKKRAEQLSGGQKQRVAIARALMNRPALVLADEPTGNLDSVNREAVYDLFRKINREWRTTFLIVTHDRSIAQKADRILEIEDGRLVQDVPNTYVETDLIESGVQA